VVRGWRAAAIKADKPDPYLDQEVHDMAAAVAVHPSVGRSVCETCCRAPYSSSAAVRASTAEHRLAACVLDPPNGNLMDGVPQLARHLGLSQEAATALPMISDQDQATLMTVIDANAGLR